MSTAAAFIGTAARAYVSAEGLPDFYVQAITGLETELQLIDRELEALQARRPRVETALTTLRELQTPSVAPSPAVPQTASVTATVIPLETRMSTGDLASAQRLAAPAPAPLPYIEAADRRILRHLFTYGTSRPGALRRACADFVPNFTTRLATLVEAGLVHGEGLTTNRRLTITALGLGVLNAPEEQASMTDAPPPVVRSVAAASTESEPSLPIEPVEASSDAEPTDDEQADDDSAPASITEPPTGTIFSRRDAAVVARLTRSKATFVELLRVLPTDGLALHVDGAREVALRHSLRRLTTAGTIVDVGQHFQLRAQVGDRS